MSNGEEEKELTEEELLLGLDGTEDNTVPSVNTVKPSPSVTNSAFLLEEIQQSLMTPLYYFEIGYLTKDESGSGYDNYVASMESFYSIKDLINDDLFSGFLSEELINKYNELTTNPSENAQNELGDFIYDVGQHLISGTKQRQQDITTTEAANQRDALGTGVSFPHALQIKFNKKETKKGVVATEDGTRVPYDFFADSIKDRDFNAELEEELQTEEEQAAKTAAAGAQEWSIDANGIVRTSAPAWGYTTDSDGMQTIVDADGKKRKVKAPFFKGAEMYLFNDLPQSERFRLQQQMVRAGMKAPPVDEYGMWTDREANFMAALFTKATDSGDARRDIENGLQGWETTLTTMAEEYSATESFINLLNKTGYGKQTSQNVAPSTIQAMLDIGAATNGVELSARDYVNYAYVVINALEKQGKLQDEFEDSLPTDRDIILGSQFKDVRSMYTDEETNYRFFKGNNMPLVLPSMEFLTQSKGGPAPTVVSAQELVNQELANLKSNQIAGNKTLRDIQKVTRLFEDSMSSINYGSEET